MASGCNHLSSTLDQLRFQLVNMRPRFSPNFKADGKPFLAPVRRLFKPDIYLVGDEQLYSSMDSSIKEIEQDIRFLGTFLNSIRKWTNAAEVELNLDSVAGKIESVVGEISQDLAFFSETKYMSKNPLKVLDVLRNSKEKIEVLKLEIGEESDYLTGCSFELCCPLNDYSIWTEFEKSAQQNLKLIQEKVHDKWPNLEELFDAFNYKLKGLQNFLGHAQQNMGSFDQVIEDFFNHVANVVVQTANKSCYFWFKKMDPNMDISKITELLDLQHEIDLTNPEFLDFILKFMKALNRVSRNRVLGQADLVRSFLKHLLKWGNDLDKELVSLVTFLIKNPEDSTKDVQSFVTEIKAMLLGVGFLYEQVPTGGIIHSPLRAELLTKICLLKAEASLSEQLIDSTSAMLSEKYQAHASLNEKLFNSTSAMLADKHQIKVEASFSEQLTDSTSSEGPLNEQSTDTTSYMLSDKHQIGELFEVMKNLKGFSKDLPYGKVENGKQALALFEEVTVEIPLLYQSFHAKKITKFRVRSSLLMLLMKIVLFKAESFLMELLNNNARLTPVVKYQIKDLLVGLELFSAMVKSQQQENREDLEPIFQHIEAVARKITFLSYLFVANESTQLMITKMTISFSDWQDNMKIIRTKLKEVSPKFPMSLFPKTNELGFMDFLSENVGELLNYDPKSIAAVKHHIKEIHLYLEFLRSFLMNFLKSDIESIELKALVKHVIHVAYKVEYVIDLIEVETHWQQFLWFFDLLDEIRLIKRQATAIQDKTCNVTLHNVAHISSHMIWQDRSPEISEMVVSLSDEEEVIIDRLTRGTFQRDIISIIGMPGIGKTTLAKKVYNDPNVVCHFHRRAWCSVSQVYGKRELLLNIIRDIHGLPDEMQQMTDGDLELKLCQQLRKNRYLIVMDDVWDIEVLNDLERSFPDDTTGSRILITSRFHKVALEAKPDSDPHFLRPLSEEESWNLLEMKTFHKGGGCPKELVEFGKEIALQCKGLPLAVIAIAGILERTEKKQDCWEKIAERLSSRIMADPETRCKDILELSYMHLPFHLKACFLYFGAFSNDREVPVSKLIRLWIAEGFIEKNKVKSLEDVAEDYLLDLIDRSLVMISRKKSNGRVKACCIHDLLRDLCLSKAKEDNFLQLITKSDEPYASFDRSDYGSDFYDYYPSNPVTYESYRLCIFLKRKHFVYSRPFGPCTRSLIFLAYSDTYPRRPYNVSFISQHFKLLRVLDLECINMGISFPTGIELLVQLRYLAVSGDLDSIPRSIAGLRKIETLIVKGLSGKVVLPDTIWCMARLRHLHVSNYAEFDWQEDKMENCFQLDNLVTFSLPSLSHLKDAEKIIRRLPNLRILKCIFLESWDSSRNCNQFPRLDFLTQLVSLKIIYFGRTLNPGGFNLPLNLKKLTLSNFRLPWNHIHAIARLPNLQVLKLLFGAFEGQRWDMRDKEFCELKFLKLDTLNIAQWNASYEYLPKLQHLVVQNCKDLEEIPYDFAEIPTLEMIQVQRCKRSVEESVRKIEEATDGIKVIIS